MSFFTQCFVKISIKDGYLTSEKIAEFYRLFVIELCLYRDFYGQCKRLLHKSILSHWNNILKLNILLKDAMSVSCFSYTKVVTVFAVC